MMAKLPLNSVKRIFTENVIIQVTIFCNVTPCILVDMYSKSSSIMSPASGAGYVSELMSQVGRVRVDQCVSASKVVQVPVFAFLRSSYTHMTEVGGS
jgi:hypothetical protein